MKGWLQLFTGILIGIAISIFIFRSTACAGEVDGQAIAAKVADLMNLPPLETVPPVVFMEHRTGHAGETDGREVRISLHEPEACWLRIVAHEYSHILNRLHRGAMPRHEEEAIARAVEDAIDPVYRPNC